MGKATYGYALSSEEQSPRTLIDLAQRAERSGFEFVLVSDHYHPWIDRQGESAFVWGVLGAIAQATDALRVGTGVTCPLMRIHPAIIAQAAATAAALFEGRFFLGVGAGENLNEHVLGDRWPGPEERLEMLEEAVGVIRRLWRGEETTHRGKHYTVDAARIYSLPERPPPIYVAAAHSGSARAAGRYGDGLIGVSPDADLVGTFRRQGPDKATYGQVTVCHARTAEEGRRILTEWWPNTGLAGDLAWELKTPELIEAACKALPPERIAEHVPCGPDVDEHVEAIHAFERAGYDHVYVHQVGPNQEEFFEFYQRRVLPKL